MKATTGMLIWMRYDGLCPSGNASKPMGNPQWQAVAAVAAVADVNMFDEWQRPRPASRPVREARPAKARAEPLACSAREPDLEVHQVRTMRDT